MHLDLVIPTYNRSRLLRRTLESILQARIPQDLMVTIAVVDNNSTDNTREVIDSYQEAFQGRLRYVLETEKQGRSAALNAGIRATNGDLIGTIDDDEEIEEGWFETTREAFLDPAIHFIGGPCLPNWEVPAPAWLPQGFGGVIGHVDGGPERAQFGAGYTGMLTGGNLVLRRTLFDQVGPYPTNLGRTNKRLLSCEDEAMFQRILAVGAVGFYEPRLIIYHYVPASRLTKSYYRRWVFWQSVSMSILEKGSQTTVPQWLGVPRWLYRQALTAGLGNLNPLRYWQDPGQWLTRELQVIRLFGRLYGSLFPTAASA